jgi:hypothetical protein
MTNGRGRIVSVDPRCGDASACLNLRIPVIRRDRTAPVQLTCHYENADFYNERRADLIRAVVRPPSLISVGDGQAVASGSR